MKFDEVESAIVARLVTLPSSPEVSYPNSSYTPAEGTAYLRLTNMPGKTGSYSVGTNDTRYSGIAQIDCLYPAGGGRGAAMTMAASVGDHFAPGTALAYGDVCLTTEQPYVLQSYNDGAWFVVPVRVPYFGG